MKAFICWFSRVQSLDLDSLVQILAVVLSNHLTLGKLFPFLVPWLPHLIREDKS